MVDSQEDSIQLRPFNHQVGGHFLVLEMSKDRLCKPLVSREKLFYDTIPSDLREFAPGFYGELSYGSSIEIEALVVFCSSRGHFSTNRQRRERERQLYWEL